jgi:hypothetical protein
MKRKPLAFLFVGVAALAVAAAFTLVIPPADAVVGCTACTGPTRTVTGQGSGDDCAEALQQAQADAIQKSFADTPACYPCQSSSGVESCAQPSCSGPCPPSSYSATFSLSYKCQYCDFGPLDPLHPLP